MTKRIHFVTSSKFKREESAVFSTNCTLDDGRPVAEVFEFVLVDNRIVETLQPDLELMVKEESRSAYAALRKPCVVEHAGLVFEDYVDQGYPGGLTKPMWNTLGDNFLAETQSAGRRAIARAVVGYCDGKQVVTFTGDTVGRLSEFPRGDRKFYWDTIFIPDDGNTEGLTYAEIVEQRGLEEKVSRYSQSTKAMKSFLHWREGRDPDLWRISY